MASSEWPPTSGHEDGQPIHQELNPGSSDDHLLRSGTITGQRERQILQVSHLLRVNKPGVVNIVQDLNDLYVLACSDCAPANCSAAGKDDALAQKLWELSCQMLSIRWE